MTTASVVSPWPSSSRHDPGGGGSVFEHWRPVAIALKQAFRMRWGGGQRSWWWRSSTASDPVDYQAAVGDGRSSAVVMAVVNWLARTFPEAPIRVQRRGPDDLLQTVPDHPLTTLVNTPNKAYSGVLLWSATIADWMLAGNAYWAIVRDGTGRAMELWWLPASQVEPRWPDDGSAYVSHYDYTPAGGAPIRIDPKDLVHFRYGLDPLNPRKGCSPLQSLLREVYTDIEAAAYTSAILTNLGVPGAVVSFAEGTRMTRDEANQVKQDYEQRFGAGNRGRVLVLATPAKIDRLSFNPTELDLKNLRRLPEERVTAIFGVPAVVVGLGAGLDRSTFNNYAEAREAAYESNVIPTQRLFAAELQAQLLPVVGDPATEVVDFDLSDVRVLQPDQDALVRRLDAAVQGGWMTVNEAREEIGRDPLPDGDVLYVKTTNVPTSPDALVLETPPTEAPPLVEPTPLRALPPPAKRRAAAKARRPSYAAGVARLRHRLEPLCARDVAAYLGAQRDLYAARLERKEVSRLPDAEEMALQAVLGKWYARMLAGVQHLTEDALDLSFDLDDPTTRAYLAEAGANVQGITEGTRAAVVSALQEGQAAGEGVSQLAARIQDLPAFAQARATVIARTEMAYAANYASVDSFRASGVVSHVDVLDGDQDEPCASANGSRWTLEQARDNPISHPNCARAFAPVVGEAAGEAVA